MRPIDDDVEKLFDPKKNKLLRKGQAIRYLLFNEQQKNSWAYCGLYRSEYSKKIMINLQADAAFFDCIDDQAAANMLFNASKNWLKARDMEAMDGPVNFGDRDNFWGGCLAEGFTEPLYNMPTILLTTINSLKITV